MLFIIALSCQNSEQRSEALQMTRLDQRIGGVKSMGQPGDYLIQNATSRFVITGKRPSMAPHTFGGGVIDADLNRQDPRFANGFGNDLLAEVFPTISMNVAWIDETNGDIKILNDGSNGGSASICTVGRAYPFISLLQIIWGVGQKLESVDLGGEGDAYLLPYSIRTDFTLAPDEAILSMKTYLIPKGDADCNTDVSESEPMPSAYDIVEGPDAGEYTLIDIALAEGYMMGDFYLQGGSLNVFTPEVGFDENGHIYEMNLAGENAFVDPIPADYIAGTGDGTSYALIAPNSRLYIPLFTSSQTAAFGAAAPLTDLDENQTYHYERWLSVGEGDVGSALEHSLKVADVQTGQINGRVLEANSGIALSDVHVFVYQKGSERPWMEWTSDVGFDLQHDGSFEGILPIGEYELQTHAKGRPSSQRVPITLTSQGISDLVLTAAQPGALNLTVVDEANRPVPSKISIFSTEGLDLRNEILGDGYIAPDFEFGQPVAVLFSAHGHAHTILPPGEYFAVASRGIEYEIDISDPFVIKQNNHQELQLQVLRTIDTEGWISADFHVHSQPSHDSGVSFKSRIISMASEGVEYFTPTDHDYISDVDPIIEELGLEYWINSSPGTEVTTIEIGHYLGFPVAVDRLKDAGGAIDWTGATPQELIDGIRDLGQVNEEDPVVFIGHPRDGILGYFDQYGLDHFKSENSDILLNGNLVNGSGLGNLSAVVTTYTANGSLINASLLAEEQFSTDVDALEILNGKRFELLRTPTTEELAEYASELAQATTEQEIQDINRSYTRQINTRTLEEQQRLIEEAATLQESPPSEEDLETAIESDYYTLSALSRGTIDDWFNLLNLGYRYVALGNSDAHGLTGVESGCPRNYVMVDRDEPLLVEDEEIAAAIKAGHVFSTYGPFLRFYAEEDPSLTMGSTVVKTDGEITLTFEVQSPLWFDAGRLELYQNGTLIDEIDFAQPNDDTLNLDLETRTYPVDKDSWFVVVLTGEDDISPIFTTTERPSIQLQDVVADALGNAESASLSILSGFLTSIPIPRSYPTLPFALSNPIWVDSDGNGILDPPGFPTWLIPPPTDNE